MRDQWKLIVHGDAAAQLFDLDADPSERHDLAADPAYAALRYELTSRVLDGWNPQAVAVRIRERRRDKDVLDAWARSVRPNDAFRWELLPEQNRLEAVEG